MKYELIEIDNKESVGNQFVGIINDFSFDGVIFYFGPLYSSRVKSIIKDDDVMVIQTKNSKYTFKKETK